MLRKWLCQADIKIVIEPIDPVLIKSGYATIDDAKMVPVSTFKGGEEDLLLPWHIAKRCVAEPSGAYCSHL